MPISVGWVLHDSPGTWGDLLPVFGGELGIGLWFPCVYKSVALSVCASVWMPALTCSYKCCLLVVESSSLQFSSVQLLSRVRLFVTPWIAARQASLSITNSRSSTQTHVHRVSDAIQPSHPLSSPSPPAPNPSQHQSLFQWVNSSHEVAKVLEFQL